MRREGQVGSSWSRGKEEGPVGQQQGPRPYPFQHLIQVVSELHEQVDLPAGVAVHRVDLRKGGDGDGGGSRPRPLGEGQH